MSRSGIAAISAAALLGLGVDYAHVAITAEQGWRWCLDAPLERQGARVLFPLWTVTKVIDAGHYEVSKVIPDVPVAGDSALVHVGDTVSVDAVFDWNGGQPVARVTTLQLHPLRPWKEALGVVGFLVLGALLPWCFVTRTDAGGRVLAERETWGG